MTTFKDLENLTKAHSMGIAIRYYKEAYLVAAFFLNTDKHVEAAGKDIESAFEALKVKLADTLQL